MGTDHLGKRQLASVAVVLFSALALAATEKAYGIVFASTTIVVNEVEADPILGGTDTANEWIELKNVGASAVTLTGWTVSDNGGTDTIPTVTLGPGGTVIIAASAAGFTAEHPAFTGTVLTVGGSIGNGLANGGDEVLIRDGTATLVDCISWGTDTACLDPAAPATPANTNDTLQRTSNADTDTAADWAIATETPSGTPVVATAAAVGISGRVIDSRGRGIRGALVTITDSRGTRLTAVTNAFGNYSFLSVPSGDTFVAIASARGMIFGPRLISVNDWISALDFVPQ